ncbi:MAG: methylated-DNA--[protein]-cysteine S-methyltransferase [Planctomycetota bacterium]
MIRYTIFKTKWGYFGLAGTESGLLRTCLPLPDREMVKSQLLTGLDAPQYEKGVFKVAQERITAYFEGTYVNFNKDVPILLDGFSQFARSVLTACRDIKFGETISYGRLAQKVGNTKAARAVGRIMAKNPLPLVVPCHRVVRSPCLRRGKLVPAQAWIGGFSAAGGVKLKKRMLELEGQGK